MSIIILVDIFNYLLLPESNYYYIVEKVTVRRIIANGITKDINVKVITEADFINPLMRLTLKVFTMPYV